MQRKCSWSTDWETLCSSSFRILISFSNLIDRSSRSKFQMSASLRCRKCSQRIASDEEFLYDGERPLHLECYTCFHCHQSLAGQFYYRYRDPQQDGKRQSYCDRCYFRLAPVCFHCLKIIDEISLMYGEKTFHPNCFLCHRCESPFKGALAFPYKDHVYCAKCYALAQNDFHPGASHLLTERCSICRKPFQPGDLITKHRVNELLIELNEIHEINTVDRGIDGQYKRDCLLHA